MRKGRRKINVKNTKEEVKGKSREKKQIKRPKCNRKSCVETVNEVMKEIGSKEKEIGIGNCY